ncbi:MAG: hypothetical protein H7296_13600 [Bacteroidia bacterium]|nr:hypothetical protein [Bacteroidia bacterium]
MKNFVFLLIGMSVFLFVKAQKVEFGIQGGVCNYWGDLSPQIKLKETHGTAGTFIRLNLSNTIAFKAEYNQLLVSGNDKNFDFNKDRNLSFTSNISEFAAVVEFNYLRYGPFVLDKKMTSFVFVGIAAFMFNPKAKLGDKYYDLRDYQTENVLYSRTSLAIPFGIGYKYMFNNRFAIEGQLGFRKTFTDYIDDVSTVYPDVANRFKDGGIVSATLTDRSVELYGTPQNKLFYKRGNPDYDDWYMSLTVSVVMRIHGRIKCARFF